MVFLNQLIHLTNLDVHNTGKCCADRASRSHVLELPELKRLYMYEGVLKDLTLNCPRLRSLLLNSCEVKGHIVLQASLENLSVKGCSFDHEAFPRSSLLGLTRLRWQCPTRTKHRDNMLYGILPSMSRLRSLDLLIRDVGLRRFTRRLTGG